MAIVHAVGMPETESERKAIAHLRKHLPDDHHIFHNLELPGRAGLPYEYDIIVVGEYAVYAAEVKGRHGHTRLPVPSARIGPLADAICRTIFQRFRPLHRQHEIGNYEVLETIGKNDLYTTLLARRRLIHTRNRFILKVYHFDVYAKPDERRKQRERLLRDAEALHRLAGHPNVVQAHLPFPWQDNQVVLPLDWVDGYSLRGLLDAGEPLTFARKTDIVRQVCEGLAYAHRNGVIHRDVRPDNVIVPAQEPVKLVNFDCARVEGGNLRTIASRLGRQWDERYVAPEVWLDPRAASPVSDLYSVGIMLFELLTGKTPYEEIGEVTTAGRLPKMPTQFKPDLPSDVDEVISCMCAVQPQDRYGSLAQVAEDLAIIGELW